MALHVHQLRAAQISAVNSTVGDARDIDLSDGSVDAVLLLGPLYHLDQRADRIKAGRGRERCPAWRSRVRCSYLAVVSSPRCCDPISGAAS
jgi:hypothetical protein